MEKEKILQQLEEKLLPSVENVNSGQATEHDFFPKAIPTLRFRILSTFITIQCPND